MEYRKVIDGLRGVAVLCVLLYHLKVPGFQGGFIGVDVFFVISGFLLSSLIEADLREGKFSIKEFYFRRARRILPALLTVTFAVSFLGPFILPSMNLRALGRDIVSTLFFSSNIL